MIKFERVNRNIIVKVGTNIGVDYQLDWQCSDEQYAILLRQHFADKMNGELSRIRREAYEKGWADHKQRKPKETWFHGLWKQ